MHVTTGDRPYEPNSVALKARAASGIDKVPADSRRHREEKVPTYRILKI